MGCPVFTQDGQDPSDKEEQAEVQIKKLGAVIARHTGQEEAEKTRHVFQRLTVLLAKGNAALFLNMLS